MYTGIRFAMEIEFLLLMRKSVSVEFNNGDRINFYAWSYFEEKGFMALLFNSAFLGDGDELRSAQEEGKGIDIKTLKTNI